MSITVDHGSEFTAKALEEWAWRRGVKLDFIRPGKPMENGSLDDAQPKIEAWRVYYSERRPHGSLGHLAPSEFVRNRQENRARRSAELWVEAVYERDQRQQRSLPHRQALRECGQPLSMDR